MLGYHRARIFSHDSDPAVYAEFRTLEEATTYCAEQIDGQIAHALAEAECGLLTTARDIDDAVRELVLTGQYVWVSCATDPKARDAFVCEIYARARLKEAALQWQKLPQRRTRD